MPRHISSIPCPAAALLLGALLSALLALPFVPRTSHAGPLPELNLPAVRDLPLTELLDSRRQLIRARSEGNTSDGRLVHGRRLDPGDETTFYVLPAHAGRDTHWGTDPMVETLTWAAAALQERSPGPRLGVGNLSTRQGGRIPWSRSHRCGRDADLAFFYLDAQGNPVEATDLHPVRSDLTTRVPSGWRLDVPRTWLAVQTLLESPHAQVQWLFVSRPIRAALLRHAATLELPPALLEAAERVLLQPGDSAPHHDHLHLRIFCDPVELLEGCRNRGPEWPHTAFPDDRLLRRALTLLHAVQDSAHRSPVLRHIWRELPHHRLQGLADAWRWVGLDALDTGELPEPHVREWKTLSTRLLQSPPAMLLEADASALVLRWRVLDPGTGMPWLLQRLDQLRALEAWDEASALLPALTWPDSDAAVDWLLATLPGVPLRLRPLWASALCTATGSSGPWPPSCQPDRAEDPGSWHDWWREQRTIPRATRTFRALEASGLCRRGVPGTMNWAYACLESDIPWVWQGAERAIARALNEPVPWEELDRDGRLAWWSTRIRPEVPISP